MFAAAAREAVFANPEIVRRINAEFIPVALKAAMVNNPPGGIEGQLYAELSRTKPAPQGICVANSAGKALAWALSFDSDASIGEFLDHTLERYQESPGAEVPVTAQRYMKFPSNKMPDIADTDRSLTIPQSHQAGERCPALPVVPRGTLVGRIIGRPLDDEGQPIKQTTRQEDYMEARFEVPAELQQRLARAIDEAATGESFTVPQELARSLVSHAYLGQLDVNPLGGRQTGGQTEHESIEFRATVVPAAEPGKSLHLTGKSNVRGGPSQVGVRTDGRRWEHQVQLDWEGYVDLVGDRITRLVLSARGTERLRWGSQHWNLTAEPDVAHLMAGHPIDLDCEVRYGLIAESGDQDQDAPQDQTDNARPHGQNADLPPAVAQQIQRLRQAGQDQQADRLEQAARNRFASPANRQSPANSPSIEQRLAALREAAQRLRAAGVTDLAEQVEQQIRQIEPFSRRDGDPRER